MRVFERENKNARAFSFNPSVLLPSILCRNPFDKTQPFCLEAIELSKILWRHTRASSTSCGNLSLRWGILNVTSCARFHCPICILCDPPSADLPLLL